MARDKEGRVEEGHMQVKGKNKTRPKQIWRAVDLYSHLCDCT